MQKSEREHKRTLAIECDSLEGPYYSCPICGKIIRYVIHPSMGEAWSRGRVRGEHLRSHNIDHHFISPGRKDDPVFIKTLFNWNRKMAKRKKKGSMNSPSSVW